MPEKPPALRRRPMAGGSWVRSLQCKSTAAEDVATTGRTPVLKKPGHPLLPRSGCASSGDAQTKHVTSSTKPGPGRPKSSSDLSKKKVSSQPRTKAERTKTKPTAAPPSPSSPPGPLGPLPALTELPAGHSSRQVVEIIFLSSWSALPVTPGAFAAAAATTGGGGAFPGEVEMLFRVHNPARAVARFEDYRAAVRARAGGASRSAADGNEMMRFSPAPPYHGSPSTASGGGGDGGGTRIRTFDGSGGAHASARGPASCRRAMFLCRVIAGRVAEEEEEEDASPPGKEHDSVRVGKGELVVFDRRAVLPCFLIIYTL
ncbi:hypothetical protein ACP4OV_000474 [Aristida adscensionis]